MPLSRAQKRNHADIQETPYDDLICFNLYKGWRTVQELYASVFPDNMNPQRSYVLGLCTEKPVTASYIAAVMHIDDAAISNLIKRMEKDELVKRTRSKIDKRSFEITATDHGKDIMVEISRKAAIVDKELYKNISKQDIASLKNITGSLTQI